MYKSIYRISFSRLLKLELPVLARGVIGIVERHDPETLKIKELFDKLEEQKPKIKKLEVTYGPHPLTQELSELRSIRIALASGILNQLKTVRNGKVSGMQEAFKVAQPVAHRYLHKLSKHNNKVALERVTQFFDSIEEDETLEEAFSTLNLTVTLNEMRSANSRLMVQFNKKRTSVSERPDDMTSDLVNSILFAMNNLFADIELSQIKNQELDYAPLIDELNVELKAFELLINKRASYNKKKAEGVVDDNEVVIDDESTEPITTTGSNMRIYPMNEKVEETRGTLDDVDKKKTVAVSTITTQLPIVPTKA